MSTLRTIAAAGLTLAFAVAQAQTSPTTGTSPAMPTAPSSQGLSSVDKNLARDPDNKGLQTADQHLRENQARYAARKATVEQRVDTARANRIDRPMRPERAGR